MKPVVSVVIASHNENWHTLNRTVKSIRDTGGCFTEIIVVDDASSTPVKVDDPEVKVLHNKTRLGVGASRHLGVEAATADLILITDAHVIMGDRWLEAVMGTLPGSEHLVLCGQCLSLQEGHDRLEQAIGTYNGARMVILDSGAEPRWRVLTCKWIADKPGHDLYNLSGAMGAAYCFHKSFFLRIGGLRMLRGWGGDEELLSLKTIRVGGIIKMFKSLKIGHRFRSKISKPQYRITVEECLANTITTCLTCVPEVESAQLIDALGREKLVTRSIAMAMERANEISAERDRLAGVLTMPWPKYLQMISDIDA